ncbi:hypothetical protein K525DRAFT_264660 [Schizophyllum commune Loenen D]|nr:hypothetical protein K525DRAFT_264660 [Schizophyllum commune Loenen D]
MSLRQSSRWSTVEDLLERAASIASLAMLRTYAEPSLTQIAAISEYTALLESELSRLSPDDTHTRNRILSQLDIHRSILAPIRRLPIEILSHIFSLVVRESPLRTLQVATTISHVCTTWRNVARRHAALWTKVIVATLRDFDEYCETFLPLTKQVPLELRCDVREIQEDLWDRIAPYASRWRRIKLEGRLSTLQDLRVVFMENLERLVIDAYGAPLLAEISALDFVVAPRLRHVALTLDALQSERQLHIPATRSLTSLEIASVSSFPVTLALPLLQACAGTLQSLTIKIRQASSGADTSYPTSSPDPFVMKALTYLSLVDPACALLSYIAAPITKEIALSTVPAYGTRALLGFQNRGQPSYHLHTLRVYDVEERDPSSWLPCLELMGNLRHLHFDDLLSNKQFRILEAMIEHEGTPPLLPSLEGIAIWRVFWSDLELHDAIADMCTSRVKEKERTRDGRRRWKLIHWLDAIRELHEVV